MAILLDGISLLNIRFWIRFLRLLGWLYRRFKVLLHKFRIEKEEFQQINLKNQKSVKRLTQDEYMDKHSNRFVYFEDIKCE